MITVRNIQPDTWGTENHMLPLFIFKNKFNAKLVEGDADIIVFNVSREKHRYTTTKKIAKKLILLSGENLFYIKPNIGQRALIKIEKLFNIDLFFCKRAMRLILLKLLPNRQQYKPYLSDVRKMGKDSLDNAYAIIPNDIKGKNVCILPHFIGVLPSFPRGFEVFTAPKVYNRSEDKKFCCIVVSNDAALDRIHFFKKLSKYKKVDFYGRSFYANSHDNELGKGWRHNSTLFERYKFVICFENSFNAEYITEKLPNAMMANAIPIYRGAPDVGNYFNVNSFINYENYGYSYDKMIEKIIELDTHEEKYAAFFQQPWMTQGNLNNVHRKVEGLEVFLKNVVNS